MNKVLSRSNTQFLTGIRGYAALAIIMVHCTGAFKGRNEYIDNFLNFGKYGVVAFFVLSAFSLSISMQKSLPFNRKNLVCYLRRRFYRIMPLYLIVTISIWLMINLTDWITTSAGDNFSSLLDLFSHATLVNVVNHQYANSIIGVEWTIQLEMLAYLFLPALFYFTRNHSWKLGMFITIALYAIGKQDSLFEYLLPEAQTFYNHDWSLWKYLFAFYAGALSYNRIAQSQSSPWLQQNSLKVTYVLLAFLPIFATFFPTSENLIVTLWVILLIYMLLHVSPKNRILFENKIISKIGKTSFSIYLLHLPIYNLLLPKLEMWIPSSISFVVFIISVMFISGITFKIIEEPFIKWSRSLAVDKDESTLAKATKSN